MTTQDGHRAPEGDPAFLLRQLLSSDDVGRALKRMAHEIIERNKSLDEVVVVGLQSGGVPFAQRLGDLLAEISGRPVASGSLDVSFYRDDLDGRPAPKTSPTDISIDLTGRTVVIVDDVLYTGRTVRAALNALSDWGRPTSIQLAVMVDRGHRELPIRPDYVGKNVPTSRDEQVTASLDGIWLGGEQS
jgi:pyrimidine operon attenuation protein/uracil phosphoribosyltransferase